MLLVFFHCQHSPARWESVSRLQKQQQSRVPILKKRYVQHANFFIGDTFFEVVFLSPVWAQIERDERGRRRGIIFDVVLLASCCYCMIFANEYPPAVDGWVKIFVLSRQLTMISSSSTVLLFSFIWRGAFYYSLYYGCWSVRSDPKVSSSVKEKFYNFFYNFSNLEWNGTIWLPVKYYRSSSFYKFRWIRKRICCGTLVEHIINR